MKKVILNPNRDFATLHHHPWIFSGAIRVVEGKLEPGEAVYVQNASGQCLGWGSYSPESQIRVRMLSFDARNEVNAGYVAGLVNKAVARRSDFFADETVTGFRLIHAESDGLPGVVADWYDGWIVVQLATCGAEYWKHAIVDALMKIPGAKGVFNRSDVDSRKREGLPESKPGVIAGDEPPELIEIREGNIRYFVDVRGGHKTGFYLDQRDAREMAGGYAKDCEVLNCFSYTGGFGLTCLAHGAKKVTNLDLSQSALDLAEKNVALLRKTKPEISGDVEFVCADVFKQLRLYRDQNKTFDLIVLDPPKFAETRSQLMRATRGYKDINLIAMKLLRPGGILASFSCSGAVTGELFNKILAEAAFDAKRDFQIVSETRQGADHPVSLAFPEGLYLKGVLLRAVN